jgi:uncharacterized NAD(P)/FAD-binding protein YdhS
MGPRSESVGVIGGGASGVLAAIHLLRDAPVPVRIIMIEPRTELGRGVAYGTDDPGHLLNVRANCMSALPDAPDHFASWARQRAGADGNSFLPRAWYGPYLRSLLEPVEHVPAHAIGISPSGLGAEIALSDGSRRTVDRVVLAPGSSPPAWPHTVGGRGARWIRDPWQQGALAALRPDEPVLLVGSGLTAVDTALSLHAAGHQEIVATSRHGLLPAAHPERPLPPMKILPPFRPTARTLFAWARATAERAGSWAPIVDALRPRTDDLWGTMEESEQLRLLRHAQRRWETQRHCMAPSIATRIGDMMATGQLAVVAGGVQSWRQRPDAVEVEIGGRRRQFGAVINCTGPTAEISRSNNVLIRHLLALGVARPGPLGLGLDTDDRGCLPGSGGTLWLVGPLRRGRCWETTAIPDIRGQAAALPKALWQIETKVMVSA